MYSSSSLGLIHFIAALLSLVTGTAVLAMAKGTRRHRLVGYGYWFSMAVMLVSSFLTYNLFGGWGIFHWFSVVSSITLIGGIIPVFVRKSPNWVEAHFAFMYWSVFGLYAALWSEILTRVPETPFFNMVGIATFLTMAVGYAGWARYKTKWNRQFVRPTVQEREPLFG
ncbi:MAG: hypothetical protein HKN29_15600 [Rhodothermales bacterium]|nr:hypothetical protein [Rhodothermales bacterium]